MNWCAALCPERFVLLGSAIMCGSTCAVHFVDGLKSKLDKVRLPLFNEIKFSLILYRLRFAEQSVSFFSINLTVVIKKKQLEH